MFLEGAEHLHEWRTKGWRPVTPKLGFLVLVLGLAGEGVFTHVRDKRTDDTARIARRKIAVLHRQARRLGLKEEQLRATNLELVQLLQPRSLTPERWRALRAVLQPYAGQRGTLVLSAADPEGYLFAKQLSGLFPAAGWDVDVKREVLQVAGMPLVGIRIEYSSDEPTSQAARALIDALNGLKIDTVPIPLPDAPPGAGRITVTIGAKPVPMLPRERVS